MKQAINLLIISILIFGGCSTQEDQTSKEFLRKAAGGRYYGGVFRLNEASYINSFYPPTMVSSVSQRVASMVYEGLVKFNQNDLTIMPAIAESWNIDPEGILYTFKIRENIFFHDDACFPNGKGKALNANDIKWCYENLAKKRENNSGFKQVLKDKVVGATEYSTNFEVNTGVTEIEGIKVVDDYTLQIQLEKPLSNFLFLLAMPACYIYPKEADDKYGSEMHVGTGPFRVKSIEDNSLIILERNDNYYRYDEFGNQLPFLDGVRITFIAEMDSVVEEFKRENYDLIYALPTDFIIEIAEYGNTNSIEYITQRTPEMLVQYYEFLNKNTIFESKELRQAFNYAIDRELIKNKVLQGEVVAGVAGITPNVFEGYDISQIKGYDLDIDKARKLLSKAGYPDGKNLPEIILDINEGVGQINVKVAEEIKNQLKKNINVNMSINVMPFNEKIEKSRKGELTMWRSGWRCDYPHPESFLSIFYGRDVPDKLSQESYPNTSRYVNPVFDELYEKGLRATSIEEGFTYFRDAEQVVMDDAPVMILYYSENYRLLQPYVSNFPNNPMQYRDFSEVYFNFSELDKTMEQAQNN